MGFLSVHEKGVPCAPREPLGGRKRSTPSSPLQAPFDALPGAPIEAPLGDSGTSPLPPFREGRVDPIGPSATRQDTRLRVCEGGSKLDLFPSLRQ